MERGLARRVLDSPSPTNKPMSAAEEYADFFAYVDAHQDEYVERLAKCVAIEGVSAEPERRGEVLRTMDHVADIIRGLGGKVTMRENPLKEQSVGEGRTIPLPPMILGEFHVDPTKKTVVVYGMCRGGSVPRMARASRAAPQRGPCTHTSAISGHLDVQPAAKEDGWDTEPFVLTEVDGKLYGRGSTDDKGALGWAGVGGGEEAQLGAAWMERWRGAESKRRRDRHSPRPATDPHPQAPCSRGCGRSRPSRRSGARCP